MAFVICNNHETRRWINTLTIFRSRGPISISDNTSYRKMPQSRSCGIGTLNYWITLKFDWHIGNTATKVSVTFQSDCAILNTSIAASRLCEILRLDVLSEIETRPRSHDARRCYLLPINVATQEPISMANICSYIGTRMMFSLPPLHVELSDCKIFVFKVLQLTYRDVTKQLFRSDMNVYRSELSSIFKNGNTLPSRTYAQR